MTIVKEVTMSEKKSEDVLVPATTEDQTPVSKTTKKNADLTESQKKAALTELTKIEKRIKEGIIKYFETGMLLQEIRDKRLYELREHKNFTTYCNKVFHFSRSYGYRLIAYCNIWNSLSDDEKDKIPERVIRALSMVEDPKERQEVWDKIKAVTNGELPTYKIVENEVKTYREQKQLVDAKFDPGASPDLVFCRSLKAPVSRSNPVEELIAKSDGEYSVLLRAAKEMFQADCLDSEACDTLKKELSKRHEEFLDGLFKDDGSEE